MAARLPEGRAGVAGLALLGGALVTAGMARGDTFRIEIDYMVGGAPAHSHQPSQAVIDAVVQMFACQGHTLIINVDDALTHYNVLVRDPASCSDSLFSYNGAPNSYGAIKQANFNNGSGWHYCIFGHNYQDSNCNTTTSGGLAEVSGDDFVVTLGSFASQTGTLFDQAATLAHEFGHNLGLTHCGSPGCDDDPNSLSYLGPYVPILPSVMTYRYQLAGVRTGMLCFGVTISAGLFKEIDYSDGRMCPLDENLLNETFGTQMISVDWDCDGVLETPVAQDINGGPSGWCGATGNRTFLGDLNEWANISDAVTFRSQEDLDQRPEISCITAEEWEEMQREALARGGCPQPPLATETCLTGLNVYINPTTGFGWGTCLFPYEHVQNAHDASPEGSVFYIAPGTYEEVGGVLLSRAGVYTCNTGTALIREWSPGAAQ